MLLVFLRFLGFRGLGFLCLRFPLCGARRGPEVGHPKAGLGILQTSLLANWQLQADWPAQKPDGDMGTPEEVSPTLV